MSTYIPTEIRLRRQSRRLDLSYEDETLLAAGQYLRVPPSAEVGPRSGQGCRSARERAISVVEAISQYAIKIVFDDGHDTGPTPDYLYELGTHQARRQPYLDRLAAPVIPSQSALVNEPPKTASTTLNFGYRGRLARQGTARPRRVRFRRRSPDLHERPHVPASAPPVEALRRRARRPALGQRALDVAPAPATWRVPMRRRWGEQPRRRPTSMAALERPRAAARCGDRRQRELRAGECRAPSLSMRPSTASASASGCVNTDKAAALACIRSLLKRGRLLS